MLNIRPIFQIFQFGLIGLLTFFSTTLISFAQNEYGKAEITNKHQITLDATSALHQVYYAPVELANFDNSAAKALAFFEARIKNNHVRFEIIGEKSILVIHLSNYAKSPKSVAEWNNYFAKKSASISN